MLVVLVERNGHLVEKDELLRLVWADSFVEEANIARIIHELRKTLGEDKNGNKFIETVAKKGYRFVAEVEKARENCARFRNGNQTSPIVIEKLPETELQIPLSETDKIAVPLVSKPKHKTRIILFTIGFVSAVFRLSCYLSIVNRIPPST